MDRDIVLLARQPIFDNHLVIVGYELLFRPHAIYHSSPLTGDQATSQLIVNILTGPSLSEIVGPHPAYINFTHNLLYAPPPLPAQQCVIEILEEVPPSQALLEQLKKLKQRGYLLALDDFLYRPNYAPLLEVVDIVKLDVLALSEQQLWEHIQLLSQYPVKILAEKVETQTMYTHCRALGCDYFQGFFLAHPEPVKGTALGNNRLVVLNLLHRLHDPEVSFDELETLIAQDAAMSFKLLQLVNSAQFYRGHGKKIGSLRQALMLLGLRQLRHWCSLLALTRLDDKPQALYLECLLRAKMCEALGDQLMPDYSARFFTTGLFSMLDAIFNQDLAALLASIPLEPQIRQALLHKQGVLGVTLEAVIAYEEARWQDIPWQQLKHLGLSEQTLTQCYQDSLYWVNNMEALLPRLRPG